jgi:hypothetical protein
MPNYSKNLKGRSLTPVTTKKINESSHNLNDPLTPKDLPKIKRDSGNNEGRIKTETTNPNLYMNKTYNKNSKNSSTPNNKTAKQDIKNFIMFNQNNNYTKKFIIKQTIENSGLYKKSNSKDNKIIKSLLKGEKENGCNISDKEEVLNNKVAEDNLNLNLQNVNISLNNNLNLKNEIRKYDERKLSILDIGGGPLINMDNILHSDDGHTPEKNLGKFFLILSENFRNHGDQ